MSESIRVTGNVEITVIDAETGEIIEQRQYSNIITNLGKRMLGAWLAGTPPLDDPDYNVDTRVTAIAVGDGNSTPAVTQTALDNELDRKTLYPTADTGCNITVEGDGQILYTIFFDETELNGETLREMALYSETFTNFMISRFLCGNLSKTSAVQFRIKYRLKIQQS